MADKLAGRAANSEKVTLDADVVKTVLDEYALTQLAQMWLVAILHELVTTESRNHSTHDRVQPTPFTYHLMRSTHSVLLFKSSASCTKMLYRCHWQCCS